MTNTLQVLDVFQGVAMGRPVELDERPTSKEGLYKALMQKCLPDLSKFLKKENAEPTLANPIKESVMKKFVTGLRNQAKNKGVAKDKTTGGEPPL